MTSSNDQKTAQAITKEYNKFNNMCHGAAGSTGNRAAEFLADAIAAAVFNSGDEGLMNYFEANASH